MGSLSLARPLSDIELHHQIFTVAEEGNGQMDTENSFNIWFEYKFYWLAYPSSVVRMSAVGILLRQMTWFRWWWGVYFDYVIANGFLPAHRINET